MLMKSRSHTEVKGHLRSSWKKVQNEKFVIWVSFEKLKSDWNQTWFMNMEWEPSYVDEVKVT